MTPTMHVQQDVAARATRRGRLITILIMASAFGPYTPLPGIRTEQAAVYLTALLCVAASLSGAVRATRGALAIAALMGTQIVITFVGGLFPPINTSGYQIASFAPAMDNVTLPLAVITIFVVLASRGADVAVMLRAACGVLIIAMCVNAVIALISAQTDLTWLLSNFWDNQSGGDLGAFHDAVTGRYVGIINLPAEAGELYGLAFIAAVYLLRQQTARLITATSLLTVGGLAAVSKTFLFVGLSVGGWLLLRWAFRRPARLFIIGACAYAGNAAMSFALTGAARGNPLSMYLNPDASVETVTAGRFGGGSSLAPVTHAVLTDSPLFGYGARCIVVALDNGWVEALAVSGVVGGLAYTLLPVVLVGVWWRRRKLVDGDWSRLSIGAVLVAVGASVGMPGLTINRCATVVWTLLTILLLTPLVARIQPGRPAVRAARGTSRRSPRPAGH